MSPTLELVKSGLDTFNRVGVRLAAVLPPEARRKVDSGEFAQICERNVVELAEAFHHSFVKERAIASVSKKWADIFHLYSSIASTQYLWLTYLPICIYSNCVDAISQAGVKDD